MPDERVRLVCIAHAGAGPSAFRSWRASAPAELTIDAASLPAREARYGDPMPDNVVALVRDILDRGAPWDDRPFALFGHSMGALVAFELARMLRREGLPAPRHLFVSAARAPHVRDLRPPTHALPERLLVAELRRLQGTPAEVLEDPQMLSTLVAVLRGDLRLVESYRHRFELPLSCPITCLGGVTDERVERLELAAWRRHTARRFRLRLFPGGHFYVYRTPVLVLRALAAALQENDEPLGVAAGQATPDLPRATLRAD